VIPPTADGRILMSHRALGLVLLVPIVLGTIGCRLGASPYPVFLESPDPHQRIEAIMNAAKAGDRTMVPRLVDRLEDEDEAVRFYAILALERLERTRLGYDYANSDAERASAVRRWREYVRAARHRADIAGDGNAVLKAGELR
jgi:hypothetical protein